MHVHPWLGGRVLVGEVLREALERVAVRHGALDRQLELGDGPLTIN